MTKNIHMDEREPFRSCSNFLVIFIWSCWIGQMIIPHFSAFVKVGGIMLIKWPDYRVRESEFKKKKKKNSDSNFSQRCSHTRPLYIKLQKILFKKRQISKSVFEICLLCLIKNSIKFPMTLCLNRSLYALTYF